MLRSLFLQAPSFDGFDGGAGARYQMKREVRSFWYPTWLAQPAALVEGSKLIDAPPSKPSNEGACRNKERNMVKSSVSHQHAACNDFITLALPIDLANKKGA